MPGQGEPASEVSVVGRANVECGYCGQITEAETTVLSARRKAGLPYICPKCGEDLIVLGSRPKRGKTDSQKRSKKQEKRAAKRVGGRTQPGSGSGPEKGDVRDPGHTSIECKLTRAKSYSLKLADLEKLERESHSGEKPALEIEFQGVYPHKRYVVLPGWLYDYYSGLAGDQ